MADLQGSAARKPDLHIMPGTLHGALTPPPSKSCAHRALICAALAGDSSIVTGLGEPSEDLRTTQACLYALLDGDNELDCGESGTTLRLLVPIAAALGRPAVFTGHGRLPLRPLRAYETAFAGKGVKLHFPEAGSLPLALRGRLLPGHYALPGDISSQYVSGLLLALPLLSGDSTLILTTPLQSAPYVDLTLDIMAHFGVSAEKLPAQPDSASFGGYTIPGGQRYRPAAYHVETDFSQAAFWLAANHLGSTIELCGLPMRSSQGDQTIVSLLARLDGMRQHPGIPAEIDASQIPDLVPILSVAAAYAAGETRIINAARLRLKESDRLASTADSLSAIGADIRQTEDGLVIIGRSVLAGGTADSCNDHRIAMALAIAALRTRAGVTIMNPWCVDKSYPRFFDDLVSLGGVIT